MKDKVAEKLKQAYREVYKLATPSADFDELLANAEINERGEKVIPYEDYEIDEKTLTQVYEKYTKRMTVWQKYSFGINYYLGATPRTKKL